MDGRWGIAASPLPTALGCRVAFLELSNLLGGVVRAVGTDTPVRVCPSVPASRCYFGALRHHGKQQPGRSSTSIQHNAIADPQALRALPLLPRV